MRRLTAVCSFALALATAQACAPRGSTPDTINTGSLYREMVDLDGLTRIPLPRYHTVQFSSYDRRSSEAEGPGWFANSDGFGGEPIPGFEAVLREPGSDSIGEYLMARVEGPGALVRFWTARIGGDIRLTLDGSPEPLYEGPAEAFFRNPLATFPQAPPPEEMTGTLIQRDAAYTPIPFARGMELVWIGNLTHTHFYQVEVREYEPGARVETFRPQDLEEYGSTIRTVTEVLSNPETVLQARSDLESLETSRTLVAGEGQDLFLFSGPGAVERLSLKLQAPDPMTALRQTVLLVYADRHPVPQVESPVGDFFGAAPGVNPYRSLPFTVHPDGTMVSRWVMPFADSLRVRLENRGTQPVTITASALPTEYDWDPERSMHFRARWRVDHEMVPDPAAVQDVPFLVAQGEGTYVGTTSILLNPTPVPTPGGGWWGEGDEKVFVDGEPRPSVFGTGSEDYYNYSWSSPDIFIYPYCGQPVNDGPGNRGFVTNYRWHILDPLPFRESIRFYMEAYPHERTPGFSYARVGYHYGRPGMTDDHLPLNPGDLREPARQPWTVVPRGGARNSAIYEIESLPGGRGLPLESGNLFSGGLAVVWRPRAPGDVWRLDLPISQEGDYRIHLVARLDPESPTLAFRVDGETANLTSGAETVNLFRPHRTLLRELTLQTRHLTPGTHSLEIRNMESPHGVSGAGVGLDFLWIQNVG